MASIKQKVHEIIHLSSNNCVEINGDVAQESVSSRLNSIRTELIIAIASAHGTEITQTTAIELLEKLSAMVRSRQVSVSRQAMAGWLPGIDHDCNDSTAAALTEAIGWAANSHFDQNRLNMNA
jgi:uncharacterized protein (DUF697 family)